MLAVLSHGGSHGYAIAEVLRQHGFRRIKGGTLYPLLKRLEDQGLVEHDWQHDEAGPGRKQFSLTEQGRRELERAATAWAQNERSSYRDPDDRNGAIMSYERRLTFNLRVRGLSEAEIAETLDEVRAHKAAGGTPTEAEFGTAEEYAKQFPKQKRRTRGKTITAISTALAVAYVLLAAILMLVFRVDVRGFVGPVTLLPAAGLVLVGLLAGFLTDYFQPAQRTSYAHSAVHHV